MSFLKKILKPKKSSELDQLKQTSKSHEEKILSQGEKYYWSEEAELTGKKLYHDTKKYVKNNPTDYLTVGGNFHKMQLQYIDDFPDEEKEIFILTGKGLEKENTGRYQEAIPFYQQAIDLTNSFCADDIQELIEMKGPGDYLYVPALKRRIRVCEKKIK